MGKKQIHFNFVKLWNHLSVFLCLNSFGGKKKIICGILHSVSQVGEIHITISSNTNSNHQKKKAPYSQKNSLDDA